LREELQRLIPKFSPKNATLVQNAKKVTLCNNTEVKRYSKYLAKDGITVIRLIFS